MLKKYKLVQSYRFSGVLLSPIVCIFVLFVLHCLSFDLRLLIASLVSSNDSYKLRKKKPQQQQTLLSQI